MFQKDAVISTLKVTSENDDALLIKGGGIIKKGIVLGMREEMTSGLLVYDGENFYGFSEKFGISLLSPHTEFIPLLIPENKKKLTIDIDIKECNNFSVQIPESYEKKDICFTIHPIFTLNSIVYEISIVFINTTQTTFLFEIDSEASIYGQFDKTIIPNACTKIHIDIVNSFTFLCEKKVYPKN